MQGSSDNWATPAGLAAVVSILLGAITGFLVYPNQWINYCFDQYLEDAQYPDATALKVFREPVLSAEYTRYCRSADRSLYDGKYALAARLADKALRLRAWGVSNLPLQEEQFADTLIELGRYADAKKVLLSLAPVDQTPIWEKNPAPFNAYRRALLGQAYLGLRDYRAVLKELRKPVPNVAEHSQLYLEFNIGLACLAVGDNRSAQDAFANLKRGGCRPELIDVYFPITKLSKGDQVGAKRITEALSAFWLELEHFHDPEAVYNLKIASDLLKQKGYQESASVLLAASEKLKSQRNGESSP